MSDLLYDWTGVTTIIGDVALEDTLIGPPIVNLPNGPFAAGSTPTYKGQLVDPFGAGIPAANISLLTLSIVDMLSGDIINGVSQTNILNTGRGTVDSSGNLTISLEAADTSLANTSAQSITRSLVIDWTYSTLTSSGSGRHQANLQLLALAGP